MAQVEIKVLSTTSSGHPHVVYRCHDSWSGVATCALHPTGTSHGYWHYLIVATDKAGNRRVHTGKVRR